MRIFSLPEYDNILDDMYTLFDLLKVMNHFSEIVIVLISYFIVILQL